MLDLTNRGYPGGNGWQLWCQCHNKRGMTSGMMTPNHPGLLHQNKWSHLGQGGLSLIYSLGPNLTELYIKVTQINRFSCLFLFRVTWGKSCPIPTICNTKYRQDTANLIWCLFNILEQDVEAWRNTLKRQWVLWVPKIEWLIQDTLQPLYVSD